ncbi:oxidoreductase [Novosphingobium mangrovi (ex Huang et al. 2023)]|uniref:Oxidoreductase n=1 Tax=Novosphingobium mangrovi (ex Huang et al. 2023) TaxID=2976432 RepID=A0ABT2I7D0_9SPHN|nr:oxidoreductase [Novosphingobium mangrovi (ex Huang et al. 2023)]MCT2400452.1 oxidoreductase [Novosphingobium mangrovi (ex Huang et al. 2023)]
MTNWLITGIGGGLGRTLAEAALARGDTVVGTTRQASDEAFTSLAPGRAHVLTVDLGDETSVRDAVARAEELTGGIDRLVNNAGYGLIGAIEEVSIEETRALFEINVFGALRMIQAVLPAMRARRAGHIVNITSVSGHAPWAGTAIYGASKYALECLGQTLAQEVAPMNIRVTNVAPGGMRTEFAGAGLKFAVRDIADYDSVAHFARRSLTENAGKEKGDPQRAAAAILQALDAPKPPLHLFLGEDALHYATDQHAFVAAQIKEWEALSLSIAYEDA